MSWLEPFVQDLLSEFQARLVNIPACTVGQDIAKSWLFACSYTRLCSLAGTCAHKGGHKSVAGLRDAQGAFLSQRTAEYSVPLAAGFAEAVCALFPYRSGVREREPCSLSAALRAIPVKPRTRPPTAAQDGGGIYSLPDWSDAPGYQADQLRDRRQEWQRWLVEKHIRLAYTSMSQMQQMNRFSMSQSQHGCRHHSEDSPTQRRPPRTGISQSCRDSLTAYPLWRGLAPCLGTETLRFFPSLRQGVPTGFDNDIPPSHTLRPRRENEPDISHDLLICEGNWQGAESDPALLQELIEEEATAGFLEEMPSLEAAFARWGRDRVAVGKVNIVKAPGRAARLVIDNSVCNTNQNCTVPEQFSLPSLQDIQAAYPLREDSEPVAGFSLDVKGAHKTALVREQDRGLLGLRQQERLFFYKVCPFGATFSSHWFSRLGGFFTRCLHLLIWISHVLMLYVDDLFFWQNEKVLPLSAASCFRIPLSWRKLQLGPAITWIGWEINFGAGCFTLPEAKRIKLSTSASGLSGPQTCEPQTA